MTHHIISLIHSIYRRFGLFGADPIIIILAILSIALTSCSRIIYEEVPVVTHDTINRTILRIDSVYDRDSIYIEAFQRGDTAFLTKYVERWRTKTNILHDTIYIHRTDTTTIPKPIERPLTKWQKFYLQLGQTTATMLLLALLYALYRLYKHVRSIIKRP